MNCHLVKIFEYFTEMRVFINGNYSLSENDNKITEKYELNLKRLQISKIFKANLLSKKISQNVLIFKNYRTYACRNYHRDLVKLKNLTVFILFWRPMSVWTGVKMQEKSRNYWFLVSNERIGYKWYYRKSVKTNIWFLGRGTSN